MERIVLVEPNPKDVWGVYDNGDGTQFKCRVHAWVFIGDTDCPENPLERKALNYENTGYGDYMESDNFLGFVGSEFDCPNLNESEYLPFKEKRVKTTTPN